MSAWVFLIHLFFYAGFYCTSKTILTRCLFWDQQQWQRLCWDALEYLQLVISFNDPQFPYNRANTDCSLHIHKKWNDMILLNDLSVISLSLKMMKKNFFMLKATLAFTMFFSDILRYNHSRSKVHFPDLWVCCDWSMFFPAQISRPSWGRNAWRMPKNGCWGG